MKKVSKETAVEPAVEIKMTKLPTEILSATLEYLATRPFKEVYQLVQAIQNQSEEA